jgi:uncharacterized lipoprotein YmbA
MKTIMARMTAGSLVASSLFLSGCSILAAQPDMSHFFVLAALPESIAQHDGDAAAVGSDITLGLGPIRLPAYLDRHEIATRLSPTQVTYSTTDRWAEPLNSNISRVLMQNLSELLGTDRIVMYPWSNAAKVDYQIRIDVLSFEATTAGEARLTAHYGILQGATRQPVAVHDVAFSHPTGTDTAAAITALSQTLGDLSQDIAATVRQLPKSQETPSATRRKP